MIESNSGSWCRSQGLSRPRRAVPRPDSGGNAGAHRAVEKFDWRRGFKFSTYATGGSASRSSGRREPRADDPRAGARRRAAAEAVARARRLEASSVVRRRGRARRGDRTSDQHWDEALGAAHASVSLNRRLARTTKVSSATFRRREARIRSTRRRSHWQAGRPPRTRRAAERERRILELRFLRGEPWTLEAIGHELDLTRERVRQLGVRPLSGSRPCATWQARGVAQKTIRERGRPRAALRRSGLLAFWEDPGILR